MDELENPYACEYCDGDGEMRCPCCDSDVDCDCCNGSGLDDEMMDVEAFQKANIDTFAGGQIRSWVWDDGETILGRCNSDTFLACADFARNKETPE